MPILLPIIALLVGTAAAFILNWLTDFLRVPYLAKPVAVIGWGVFCCAVSFAGMVILMWLQSIGDTHPGMAPLWGMLGVYLLVLSGIGGWLGVVHARRYETTWGEAFGVVMAKLTVLVSSMCLIPYILLPTSDPVTGTSCSLCMVSLFVTFLTLEFAPPLSRHPGR
jgi:hypothetical protein